MDEWQIVMMRVNKYIIHRLFNTLYTFPIPNKKCVWYHT